MALLICSTSHTPLRDVSDLQIRSCCCCSILSHQMTQALSFIRSPTPLVPSPCPNSQILWHSNFCFFLSLSRLNFTTETVCFLFCLSLLLSLGAPYCFFFYYPIATFFISQSHDVLCDCDPLSWSSSCPIPPSRLGHHTNSFSSFVRAHHVTWR